MLKEIFMWFIRGQQNSTPGEPDLTLIALAQSTNTLEIVKTVFASNMKRLQASIVCFP